MHDSHRIQSHHSNSSIFRYPCPGYVSSRSMQKMLFIALTQFVSPDCCRTLVESCVCDRETCSQCLTCPCLIIALVEVPTTFGSQRERWDSTSGRIPKVLFPGCEQSCTTKAPSECPAILYLYRHQAGCTTAPPVLERVLCRDLDSLRRMVARPSWLEAQHGHVPRVHLSPLFGLAFCVLPGSL